MQREWSHIGHFFNWQEINSIGAYYTHEFQFLRQIRAWSWSAYYLWVTNAYYTCGLNSVSYSFIFCICAHMASGKITRHTTSTKLMVLYRINTAVAKLQASQLKWAQSKFSLQTLWVGCTEWKRLQHKIVSYWTVLFLANCPSLVWSLSVFQFQCIICSHVCVIRHWSYCEYSLWCTTLSVERWQVLPYKSVSWTALKIYLTHWRSFYGSFCN